MNKRYVSILVLVGMVALLLVACGGDGDSQESDTAPAATSAGDTTVYAGKKIVWLDSYHEGYVWSDGIQTGIESVIAGTGIEFKILRMDTKHVLDDAERQSIAEQVHAEIDAFGPDVVIATDDDAQHYVIVPYYKDTATPVVFAGVNYDPSPYGYPAENVTGMVEVDLMEQAVDVLRSYANGTRIAFLTDDNTTSYRMAERYQAMFPELERVAYTNSYDEFKSLFLELQAEADLVLVYNNSGITDWDAADAEAFFRENTKVPTAGVLEWMSPYLLLVNSVVAVEHGQWSAQAALQIIEGTPIAEIPVMQNQRGEMYVNLALAAQLDIAFPPSLLRNATVVGADVTNPAQE